MVLEQQKRFCKKCLEIPELRRVRFHSMEIIRPQWYCKIHKMLYGYYSSILLEDLNTYIARKEQYIRDLKIQIGLLQRREV